MISSSKYKTCIFNGKGNDDQTQNRLSVWEVWCRFGKAYLFTLSFMLSLSSQGHRTSFLCVAAKHQIPLD